VTSTTTTSRQIQFGIKVIWQENIMKIRPLFFFVAIVLRVSAPAQLKLLQCVHVPGSPDGHLDHFAVDLTHRRLFATPERGKVLDVFDVDSGKHLQAVEGIDELHAVFYRNDLNRIFVTDGENGSLRIIDGGTYSILSTVTLRKDADSAAYDPATHYLYIDNGGKDAKENYTMISIVNTDTDAVVDEIRVESNSLEAIALETNSPRMYVNSRGTNEVKVFDRKTRQLVANWPIALGKTNVPLALDEANHHLFVGCRDGKMSVLGTLSGKELQALPITKGVDDMVFDAASKRIYIAADGAADVYEERDPGHYRLLSNVPTAPGAKTARLVPELKRYFVAAPKNGAEVVQILVFEVE
jgi:DNA-binding beta-propeller fold protein YncE